MSMGCKKILSLADNSNCTVIFINQTRNKINTGFGFLNNANVETTTGGNALKFYSSIRLEVRKKKPIYEDNNFNIVTDYSPSNKIVGHVMNIRAVKNKVSTPNGSYDHQLIYGNPKISLVLSALTLAISYGV